MNIAMREFPNSGELLDYLVKNIANSENPDGLRQFTVIDLEDSWYLSFPNINIEEEQPMPPTKESA